MSENKFSRRSALLKQCFLFGFWIYFIYKHLMEDYDFLDDYLEWEEALVKREEKQKEF